MKYTTIFNDPVRRAGINESWTYWDDGFSSDEIDSIVSLCEQKDLQYGNIAGASEGEELFNKRNSKVNFFNRNEETSWIFDRLNFIIQSSNERFYGFNLNGYDSFQFTTYSGEEHGKYDWHMDMEIGHYPYGREPRKLSLSMLLTDESEFEGGEFQINVSDSESPITVPLKKGRAIIFPSYIIHRVTPVTKGVRKSLVVWVVGPKFQ